MPTVPLAVAPAIVPASLTSRGGVRPTLFTEKEPMLLATELMVPSAAHCIVQEPGTDHPALKSIVALTALTSRNNSTDHISVADEPMVNLSVSSFVGVVLLVMGEESAVLTTVKSA